MAGVKLFGNQPNNKHTECNVNNDILDKISSFPYVLVNRSVLCNCKIEAENHFLLDLLAVCQDTKSKLVMYFMVKTASISCLDNLILWNLQSCYLLNLTTHRQILPIPLQSFHFNPDLLKSWKTLKRLCSPDSTLKGNFWKRHNNDLDKKVFF